LFSGRRYFHQIGMISVIKNGNVSSGLLLAALAIILCTCIFYLELGNMVGVALILLGLACFGYRKVLLFCVAVVSFYISWVSHHLSC
jgi:hypothetical protein